SQVSAYLRVDRKLPKTVNSPRLRIQVVELDLLYQRPPAFGRGETRIIPMNPDHDRSSAACQKATKSNGLRNGIVLRKKSRKSSGEDLGSTLAKNGNKIKWNRRARFGRNRQLAENFVQRRRTGRQSCQHNISYVLRCIGRR